MRLRGTWAPVAAVAVAMACTQGESASLATLQDSASYAVGQNMGASIREVRDEIDLDQVDLPDPLARTVENLLDRIHALEVEVEELKQGLKAPTPGEH